MSKLYGQILISNEDNLNKENFWNKCMEFYPKTTKDFCEFIDFYNRAYSFAETYFANISFNNSLVLGYTGSQTFTGSGITGSYIITTSTVGNGYGYNPDDWHYWDNNLEVEENIHYEDFYDVNQDAFWAD